MDSSASAPKSRTIKPRKRVDADPPEVTSIQSSGMKRGSNGSAFIRCETCKKDVPAAIMDMHNCQQDKKTKMLLVSCTEKAAQDTPAPRGPLKEKNGSSAEKPKRKAEEQAPKKSKKSARVRDANEPKRPPTAFFLFLEDYRKKFKDENPDSKGVSEVARSAGEKWKAMSEEDKLPFVKKAELLKETYLVLLKQYRESKKVVNPMDLEERSGENDPIEDVDES
ncbi:hypothetical protein KP509_03G026600 [Ceratopteris richardii]|uniref:HMG box domain-containing protein n=1 Tax=Ceratopteris richardii TaxID=49495 RepID=A0A8T2V5H0_CERRI|nr:hypothetical protein KP509_03G026600 [Ceratopteris richardii]